MAERVTTGGTKSFQYDKSYNPKLSHAEKQEIRNAYSQAKERKRRERTKRNIIIAIIIIAILLIITAIFFGF